MHICGFLAMRPLSEIGVRDVVPTSLRRVTKHADFVVAVDVRMSTGPFDSACFFNLCRVAVGRRPAAGLRGVKHKRPSRNTC